MATVSRLEACELYATMASSLKEKKIDYECFSAVSPCFEALVSKYSLKATVSGHGMYDCKEKVLDNLRRKVDSARSTMFDHFAREKWPDFMQLSR